VFITTDLTTHITRRLILPAFVSAVICAIILSGLSLSMPIVSAASTPQILISPPIPTLSVGQTFTATINLTSLSNLIGYQLVLKYDGTVLKLTNLWFPDGNVFSGQNAQPVWYNDTGAAGDTVDHLNYTVAGDTLIGNTSSVSVSNSVLCEANFTAVAAGQGTITVCTKDAPAHAGTATWYTFCEDSASTEYDAFVISYVPEFTPIALVMMLPILGAAVLIARKKRARQD
jgi:hypothetical protein